MSIYVCFYVYVYFYFSGRRGQDLLTRPDVFKPATIFMFIFMFIFMVIYMFIFIFQAVEVKTYWLGRTCSNLRRLSWASISAMVQLWDWRNKSYWSALYPTQTTSTHCGSNHLYLVSFFSSKHFLLNDGANRNRLPSLNII